MVVFFSGFLQPHGNNDGSEGPAVLFHSHKTEKKRFSKKTFVKNGQSHRMSEKTSKRKNKLGTYKAALARKAQNK